MPRSTHGFRGTPWALDWSRGFWESVFLGTLAAGIFGLALCLRMILRAVLCSRESKQRLFSLAGQGYRGQPPLNATARPWRGWLHRPIVMSWLGVALWSSGYGIRNVSPGHSVCSVSNFCCFLSGPFGVSLSFFGECTSTVQGRGGEQ